MQIFVDTTQETPAALHLIAATIISYARLREAMESEPVPQGTAPPPPPPPPPQQSGNVLPFVPQAPTESAPPAATLGTSLAPTANLSNGATVPPAASVAPPAADEYDTAGIPFDARIHQKTRGKKKDGSWKLQKGIADSLVASVMQELAPRVRTSSAVPPPPPPVPNAQPAGSLPPTPPAPGTQAPPNTPVPPAPGGSDAQEAYRTLIKKVVEARSKLSQEEIAAIYAKAGAPNLQALNALPDLIPVVSFMIDEAFATR